jgi:hypothetical protein
MNRAPRAGGTGAGGPSASAPAHGPGCRSGSLWWAFSAHRCSWQRDGRWHASTTTVTRPIVVRFVVLDRPGSNLRSSQLSATYGVELPLFRPQRRSCRSRPRRSRARCCSSRPARCSARSPCPGSWGRGVRATGRQPPLGCAVGLLAPTPVLHRGQHIREQPESATCATPASHNAGVRVGHRDLRKHSYKCLNDYTMSLPRRWFRPPWRPRRPAAQDAVRRCLERT